MTNSVRPMRMTVATLAAALVLAVSVVPAGAIHEAGHDERFVPTPEQGQAIPGEWIVALRPDVNVRVTARDLVNTHGGDAEKLFERALEGFLYLGSKDQARAVSKDDRVRKVRPNQPVEIAADEMPTGIRRIDADGARVSGSTGAGVGVAVLDTGIDLDHPDLVANLHPNLATNCIGSGPADDDNGHGTHVAGTVAAAANGLGVIGVAPAATLIPVKVLDSKGSGSFADVICGVDYVTANAASIKVANLSLGGPGTAGNCNDGSLREAICASVAAGVIYSVAAGNESLDAGLVAPANFPEVITVSALDDRDGAPGGDRVASFSNVGSVVDVIAPGVLIRSTARGGGYTTLSGTSMASPHVAGVAALVRSGDPGMAPSAVGDVLRRSGECPNASVAGSDGTCTSQGAWPSDRDLIAEPLVNALRAAEEVGDAPIEPPSDDAPPTVTVASPGSGATVSGNKVVLLVDADDSKDAAGTLTVEWQLDGGGWQSLAYQTRSDRYRGRWNTTTAANGLHTLTARATDSAGSQTVSAPVQVTVTNG